MKDKDGPLAFLKHDDLQSMSPGKVFDTGEYMTSLVNLTIKDCTGSRASFIKDWFEQLRLLNKFATPGAKMGYEFVKSILLKAVSGVEHLPDAFVELVFTTNYVIGLETMKLHMLKKAVLYNGLTEIMISPSRGQIDTMMHPKKKSMILITMILIGPQGIQKLGCRMTSSEQ